MAAFSQQIRVFINRNLSPEARSARLASAAREVVSELISSGRASPVYDIIVDGRRGLEESQVKPEGRITYLFSGMATAALFAVSYLQARSPSKSGTFRTGWVISVDGRQIAAESIRPEMIPSTAEVFVYNTTGYARKVDVQYVGNRRLRYSVPPNALADCAAAVRGKYGNSVSVKRVQSVTFPGQWTIRNGRRAGESVLTPALVITPR